MRGSCARERSYHRREVCHVSTLQIVNLKGYILTIFSTRPDTYRISDDLFTKKAMNWRKTICPESLSVPL
ncbi:hypothetical protein EIK16_20010, partial [Shigella flexneri]|nr:hypothetical protein [Shigella flexneri]